MKKLIAILFGALCLAAHANDLDTVDYEALSLAIHGNGVFTTSDHTKANNRLKSFEKDFQKGDMRVFAERANFAVRGLIKIATLNLKRQGYGDTAYEVERAWKGMDGELQKLAVSSRDISDFDPWNTKLSVMYLLIEAKLGYPLCYTLRITDLATYLWTPPVVFHPCVHGKTEFDYHFTADNPSSAHPYRGFFPTTTYWLTTIGCSIGTFAAGIVFPICSPIAYLVELGTKNYLSPKLATFIYEKSCQ